jgi:RNA polymerase sigma factor (sigma-70 family)
MNASRTTDPLELRQALHHAERLAKRLSRLERDVPAVPWMVGRSGELRIVVSSTVADWRAGRCSEAIALDRIRSYLDGLHRAAAKHLRARGVALDCCTSHDAVTQTADAGTVASLGRTATSWHSDWPTKRVPWTDTSDVLVRFHDELPQVEMHARVLARRLGTRWVTQDDLRAFGREGLLDAARSYDEHRGVFADWASLCIRNAIMEGVRRWSGLPRRMVRERTGVGCSAGLASPRQGANAPSPMPTLQEKRKAGPPVGAWARLQVEPDALFALDASPEEGLVQGELRDFVREAIGGLSPKERGALEGYYYADRSLKQIAAAAGMTESGAARMLTRAVEQVQAELRKRGVFGGESGSSARRNATPSSS